MGINRTSTTKVSLCVWWYSRFQTAVVSGNPCCTIHLSPTCAARSSRPRHMQCTRGVRKEVGLWVICRPYYPCPWLVTSCMLASIPIGRSSLSLTLVESHTGARYCDACSIRVRGNNIIVHARINNVYQYESCMFFVLFCCFFGRLIPHAYRTKIEFTSRDAVCGGDGEHFWLGHHIHTASPARIAQIWDDVHIVQ